MECKLTKQVGLDSVVNAIRICHESNYKSDSGYDRFGNFNLGNKDKDLIKNIIKLGHTSTLEHAVFTYYVSGVSRSLTHQLVRHRICSFSQQSQRYVKIDVDKSDWYIIPPKIKSNREALRKYEEFTKEAANAYNELIDLGISKEDARFVLPNMTESKLYMTINARSLRNLFELRLPKNAQWEIRQLAKIMLDQIKEEYEVMFKDIIKKIE